MTVGDLPTPADLTADEARTLTDRIKTYVETAWTLIEQAYLGRAWIALDYESWDAYCINEFGTARLRIPREERPEMVTSLRQAGLSIRAIASATGTGVATVHRDIEAAGAATRAGVPNGTPDRRVDVDEEQVDADQIAEELIETYRLIANQPPITGTDGKTYRLFRRPRQPKADPLPADELPPCRFNETPSFWCYVDRIADIGLYGDDNLDLVTPLTADDLTDGFLRVGAWGRDESRFLRELADRLRAALPRIQELIDIVESTADADPG